MLSLFLRNNRADASRHSRVCCQFRALAVQGGLNLFSGIGLTWAGKHLPNKF